MCACLGVDVNGCGGVGCTGSVMGVGVKYLTLLLGGGFSSSASSKLGVVDFKSSLKKYLIATC